MAQPGAAKQAMDRIRKVADVLGADGAPKLLRVAALAAEREAAVELSRPGTGRIYTTEFFYVETPDGYALRAGRPRTPHQASAPGEPPAVDSGDLRNSIKSEVHGDVAFTGTHLEYGRFLEYGFMAAHGVPVEPRPWMRTVVAYLKENLAGELAVVARQEIGVRVREVAGG